LQAAVDWSYALLNPPEKELFRRLSVFANGWDLPAAEEICGFGELRAADILDLLQELVDKSLVVVEEISIPNSGGESDPEVKLRFKLLQTLRDYGRKRLSELSSVEPGVSEWGSEAQTLQARHLLYFSAFATRHIPESGWGQTYFERKEAYQQLEVEQFNLLEGLNRVATSNLETPLVKAALEMAVPLACLWNEKNSYQESVYHLTSLKKKAQEAGLDHSVPFGRVADWLGFAVFYTGDPAQAVLFFQESFEVSTALDDKRGKMHSLQHLGAAAIIQGDFTKALEYLSASLDLAYRLGEKEDTVNSLRNLGTVYGNLGEFKKAREYFESGLKLARENGDPLTLAGLLVHTAPIVTMTGDYELAQNYLLESLPLLRANNKKVLLSSSLGNLGFIADYLDDFEGAYSYFQQALAIQKEIGFTTNIAISLHNLANLSLRVGNYDEAVNFHTESKIYFQRAPGQVSSALLAFTESSLAEYQGKFDLAIQKKREALAIFWETKELHYTLNLLKDLAWLFYRKLTAANAGEIPGSSPVSQPILGKIIWLLGAAANLLKEIDEKFKPAEQQDVDKIVEGCHQLVGVEVYERLFNEGAATPLPEVLDRVLSPAFDD
jgi:tetratricopeptide (TPR) repeat protein